MGDKVRIGIIGTGKIFGAYVHGCRAFDILEIIACADLDQNVAEAQAAEFSIPRVCPVDELLADPEIQIAINLTIPKAHTEVSLAAINAGKHVYSEKPLAINRQDGRKILATAKESGLLVGCAPDTFLGGGQQTCRKLVEDGWIGEPVAAVAFMTCHGHESWHPSPDFYYQVGGGPMLDMGPYYLTALVNLMGPVKRVAGSSRMTFSERVATSEGNYGRRIPVEVPTHVTGVCDFVSGAVATIITSFDIWAANLPRIEVYGTEGSLSVPDPNIFGGRVMIRRSGASEFSEVPLTHSDKVGRGIGVADMAYAITCGRQHRTNGELAYHVLDVMEAFEDSSQDSQYVEITSRCSKPEPLPLGLLEGQLDTQFMPT
jgi:predicted dehydrogenase